MIPRPPRSTLFPYTTLFRSFHGDVTITVTVEDDGGLSSTADFVFTVNPVNDAPVMDAITAQATDEDAPLTITVSSSDVDMGTGAGDENISYYSAESSSPGDVAAYVIGDQLTMTPALDFNGDVTITVTVTDNSGLSGITDFVLIVTPINDAPIMTEIGNQVTDEDTPLVLTLEATDVDEDNLTFSAVSQYPGNVAVEVTGDQLTLTPAEDWNGSVNISVSVSDGALGDSEIFELTVTPVNDAPTIALPESITFAEDEGLVDNFIEYLDDIDEDALTLTASGNENITVSIDGFEVTFGAVQDWNGTETLTFTVNDNQGRAFASDNVDIIVIPVNDAPVIDAIAFQATDEEESLTITVSSSDVDWGTGPGDENIPAYSAESSSPDDVAVSVAGDQLTMTPTLNFNGDEIGRAHV